MCGITGFIGSGDGQDLRNMTEMLRHRGPDEEGFWIDKEQNVFLGHRRLSIIDLEDGSQPMHTQDRALTVIFNGEIYNHLQLRKTLLKLGHRFTTDHSDTETLLHGYREWGSSLPKKLNGMWAFAIYDKTKRKLFFSRDRFGKKPLYYTIQKGTFAFSSEVKSLLAHSNLKADISARSLKKIFAYGFLPGSNSIYERIYKLPSGSYLLFDIVGIA